MADDPFQNLTAPERQAADALVANSGCLPERAVALIEAVANVAAAEALEVVAGAATVSAGVTDARVARLRALITAVPPTASFPNAFEVGAIFQITPSQAGSLIRTYQARHSADYRGRMDRQLEDAVAHPLTILKKDVWKIQFDDPPSLDYANDKLRRRGLSRSVVRDPVELTLTIARDQRDRHGQHALAVLGCRLSK